MLFETKTRSVENYKRAHMDVDPNLIDRAASGSNWKAGLDNLQASFINNDKMYYSDVEERFSEKGMRHLSNQDSNQYVDLIHNDLEKDRGRALASYGEKTSFGHSLAQARSASYKQKALGFLEHTSPVTTRGVTGISTLHKSITNTSWFDSLSSTVGFPAVGDRITGVKNGGIQGLMTRFGAPIGGILTATAAIHSDTPLTDYAAYTASGTFMQQGYRIGKSFSNLIPGIGTTHASRLFFGGVVGAVGTTAPIAVGEGLKDIGSNDSFIGKTAKKIYTREAFSFERETNTALTMRQASMRKLNSSAMNNRSLLLGNEASILRNAQSV